VLLCIRPSKPPAGTGVASELREPEQKQCEVLLMAKIKEHPLQVEVEKVW
jgi:hypothetical protein